MSETPTHAEEKAFRAAVSWAVSQLLHARAVAPKLFEPDGLEVINDLDTGLNALRGNGFAVLARARMDWRAHRALELGCAVYLRNAMDLPPWASDWLADKLEGKVPRPPRPRGALSRSGLHYLICECIEALIAAGMIGARNEATEQRSACDVLAEALRQVGLQPSTFEGVKRIYFSWNKQQAKQEQELARAARSNGH